VSFAAGDTGISINLGGGSSMPKTLYIMQGIPGSGKSTVARAMADVAADSGQSVARHSTDDLRMRNGVYVHDQANNAAQHAQNMRQVIASMQKETENIFVDNTNIKRWQARPYVSFARAFGYEVQIIRVQCDVETAIARQKNWSPDRAVPEEVIRRMHAEMEDLGLELL
jgi:predicted kinase